MQRQGPRKKQRLQPKRKCSLSVNIALTGTPGTGKTSLSSKVDCDTVSINDYYAQISNGKDEENNWLIDLDKLNEIIITKNQPNTIFEGHVAHFLKNIDKIIVLRCHPDELGKRLSSRNYSDEKIRENMEAEALNIIYEESIDSYDEKNVFEIDTSKMTIEKSVEKVIDIINGSIKSNKRIDYSETIMDWY